VLPVPLANVPGSHCGHEVLPDWFVAVPDGHCVQGTKPLPLKKPGPHNAAVSHWDPEKPTLHEQKPVVGLLLKHVPLPLQTFSQASPLEHGLHAHVPAEKFVQIPLPLQFTSHPPAPMTGAGGVSVRRVPPIASAVTTLSRVRPDDFNMCSLPPV
jgi:hypothetical protein